MSKVALLPEIGSILDTLYQGIEHVEVPSTFTSGVSLLQGCLPLFMEEHPSPALIQRLGQEKYEQLQRLYRQSTLLNLYYQFELGKILEALTSAAIPVMVLKGADIAESLYARPGLRHFGDVDLMVHPEDLASAIAIFEQSGYRYHQEYRFEAVSKERAAYVYVKENEVGYLLFEIHTAPHSNELGVSFDPTQIWQRARPIIVASVRVYGMGLEDLFVYLCWHYRSHTFNRLLWLYDIAGMLVRFGDQLNWGEVLRIAGDLGLKSTIYYNVLLCQQVFRIAIPDTAGIEKFAPTPFVRWLIVRLVGSDFPALLQRSASRKRKLLQRLMVDSVWPLALVLFRAVFPHPAHLGRLYMERSRLPLQLFWLYYPVHLLTILKVGLQWICFPGFGKMVGKKKEMPHA